jgi:hypothetical protein
MLFAYIGPETMMPVASIIAAVAGVFMMFGRNVMQIGRNMVRRIRPGAGKKEVPVGQAVQRDNADASGKV